jgi:hypothetical protein
MALLSFVTRMCSDKRSLLPTLAPFVAFMLKLLADPNFKISLTAMQVSAPALFLLHKAQCTNRIFCQSQGRLVNGSSQWCIQNTNGQRGLEKQDIQRGLGN